jgi:predicted RNase H-like HicB family nuclease
MTIAADILRKPYSRVVVPDENGTFTAEIFEFPGCIAIGDTAGDALANLDDVAADWISTTLEQGQDIPEPIEASDFSGKLVLRMTSGLHKRATMCAERERVSLNQFIVTCLAEAVGERAKQTFASFHPQIQAVANFSFFVPAAAGSYLSSGQPVLTNQTTTVPFHHEETTHARG